MTDIPADSQVIRDGQRRTGYDRWLPVDVRCELCELPDQPVWVFRTDHFKLGYEGQEALEEYPDDTEWAACATCSKAVLDDTQEVILQRRRSAATVQLGGVVTSAELDEVLRMLDLTIMAFLSCRQKSFIRPFTNEDFAAAARDVKKLGRRA